MSGTFAPEFLRALERAVHRALTAWSLPEETRLTLLGVSENVTFLLRHPDSEERLVLRVHRPGYHSVAEIRSELAWIMALASEAGIRGPAPVPTAEGELIRRLRVTEPPGVEQAGASSELVAVLFEHVAGQPPAPGENLPCIFRALGAMTARLHRQARNWRRPAGFTRLAWTLDSILGDRPVWGDWRAGPGLDRPGQRLLERAEDSLRGRLARFGTAPDRFGLIHADLRPANLLGEAGALRPIDFDDCGFGWFAYDFAASVSFFEDAPMVPELLAAWLEGYRVVAPLARTHTMEIPALIMLRRLLLLAWIGSHPEAPTAHELGAGFAAGTLELAERFLSGRYGS